ncbi:MAG TPA: DUF72 domain-containing protein [Solirubrobacteraceae bacterium]|nr:DUF72 domain-containing protein [Solirubrobacteraceae bacterium]
MSAPDVHVGTSGWAYPSWKPGFYPPGTPASAFLAYYAERFRTVELNTTGYRLPAEDQVRRWAERTPPGFQFAPKLNAHARAPVAAFCERMRALGDRLGPVRLLVAGARDDALLARLEAAVDPGVRVAWDFRHPSWKGVALPGRSVAVGDLGDDAPFRYLRLREPPYSDDDLRRWAARIRALRGDVFVFFRHEREPTAPRLAARLAELLAAGGAHGSPPAGRRTHGSGRGG